MGLRLARGLGAPRAAPVVFSSNLGDEPFVPAAFREAFGDLHDMISQTPQVWLDHQLYRVTDGVLLAWDSVDGLFPDGMLDAMFDAYIAFVQALCDRDWRQPAAVALPPAPRRVRDHLPEDEAAARLRQRFAIINVWRALDVVERLPLALCDARTIAPDDLVPSDLVYRDKVGETYSVVANPAHRWFYFPRLRADEVLLLKIYDSLDDGRGGRGARRGGRGGPRRPVTSAIRRAHR